MTMISNNAIQKADGLSKAGFNKGSSLINYIEDQDSYESVHADFMSPVPEASKYINQGAGMLEASKALRSYCEKTDEDTEFPGKLQGFANPNPKAMNDFLLVGFSSTKLENQCEEYDKIKCNPGYKYRDEDGSCNNLRRPIYGRGFTPFQRLFEAEYGDTVSTPKIRGRETSNDLPSARHVSNSITNTETEHTKYFTSLFTVMGQFIDHDLTFTPNMRKFF